MKTVFIVNPMAGKKKNIEKFCVRIKETAKELSADVEIYITKAVGDTTDFVKKYIEKNGAARFISCGGDGTLSETLTGAAEFSGCEIGVMPMGTGNDFCRNFPSINFSDIAWQINSGTQRCDAIKYTTELDGKTDVGYCVNMSNIGFDCNVVDMTDKIQKFSLLLGPLAYFIAIFFVLVKKKGADIKIEYDGKLVHDGPLLLTSIANGCFCGGGMRSNPLACVTNGKINGNIIYNISRFSFLSKLPHYMRGTYKKIKNYEKVIYMDHSETVTVTPNAEKMRLCVDGEIRDAGKTVFEIVPEAFSLVVPGEKTEKIDENKELVKS